MNSRRTAILLTIVFTIVPTAAAMAGIPNVVMWFEAQPLSPAASVVMQGMPGQDVVLGCDTQGGPADCDWRLTMMMDNTPAGAGIDTVSIAADFLGDPSVHSIDSVNFTTGDYPADAAILTSNPAAGVISRYQRTWIPVVDVNGTPTFVYQPVGQYSVLEFTLHTKAGGGAIEAIGIGNNHLLTALANETATAGDALIQWGDAPVVNGSDVNAVAEDVIRFIAVPEPSAGLMLFGAFAVAALRRRR